MIRSSPSAPTILMPGRRVSVAMVVVAGMMGPAACSTSLIRRASGETRSASAGLAARRTSIRRGESDCGLGGSLVTRGPLSVAAHGTVAGHHWVLETDHGRRGAGSVRAGRFLLDGRVYGFSRDPVDLELIDAAPHGIAYGYAPRAFTPPIVIEGTPAHGTASHPVLAHEYPATTVVVAGGILFVRALLASACAYDSLAVSLPKAPTSSGGSTETVLGQFMGACHPGRLVPTPHEGFGPSLAGVPPPAGLSAAQ